MNIAYCSGLLYLGALILLLHDFFAFRGAVNYLQVSEGFSTEAISMLVCVGANLIAAILAIKAGIGYKRLVKARDGPEEGPQN